VDIPRGGSLSLDARLLRFRSRPGSEPPAPLAEALLSAGRTAEALEVVAAGLRAAPGDATLLRIEGLAWLAEGELERAQASLVVAARGAATDPLTFRALGEVLLRRGDPVRALKVLERAAALDPASPQIRQLRDRAARLSRLATDDALPAGAIQGAPAGDDAGFDEDERTSVADAQTLRGALDVDARLARDEDVPVAARAPVASASAGQTPATATPPARPAGAPPARTPKGTLVGMAAPPAFVPPARAPKSTLSGTAAPPVQPTPALGSPGPAPPAATPPPPARPETPSPFDEDALTNVTRAPSFPSAAANPPRRGPAAASPARSVPASPPPTAPEAPPPEFGSRSRAGFDAQATTPRAPKWTPTPAATTPLDSATSWIRGGATFGASAGTSDAFEGASPLAGPDPFAPAEPSSAQPSPRPRGASASPAASTADDGSDVVADASLTTEPNATGDAAAATGQPLPHAPSGERFGAEEDVEAILEMLQREGIFEPPTGTPAVWATRKEVPKTGSRIGRALLVTWLVTVVLAAGGWFAWVKYVEGRHAAAARLLEQAAAEAKDGDHASLVDAERHLREARDLDPHAVENVALLLFVQIQRALEEGAFEAGYLRPTLDRARRERADPARIAAAQAVLAVADGKLDDARRAIGDALAARPDDAVTLYVAGRLEQRLGDGGSLEHLEAAVEKDPALFTASIALAEARADDGNREEALRLLDAVLARRNDHLRAKLWRTFLAADEVEPDAGLAELGTLAARLDRGAPTDRVVAKLIESRLHRRKGDDAKAAEAIDAAIAAGASEPRLLALVAVEARGAGRLDRAQQAATQAVAGAPSNGDFRKLLAEIQVARRDGVAALATLGRLSTDDPAVMMLSARAALLVGAPDSLAAAASALDAFLARQPDSVEGRALQIRLRVKQGATDQLEAARRLAREAPGDPLVAMAVGEAALAARDGPLAVQSLTTLVRAAPDDPEAHYLLGRARRLAADPEGAEQSFRRAIELGPAMLDARVALGGLLLDRGKYEEADAIYQELARRAGVTGGQASSLLGRLGRVEALLGMGRFADARVQFEGIRADDRDTPSARMVLARLALAENRPGEAVAALRPLVQGEGSKGAELLSLHGDALFATGEFDAAAAQYDAALGVDSGFPEALLGRARVAVRAGRASDALAYLERLRVSLESRIRPPALRALMLTTLGMAKLLDRRDRRAIDTARSALRQATEMDGAPPEAFFYLGEVTAPIDAASARVAYQRYLELAPDGEFAARARRALFPR
jgi:tetratricopeptide (TPR) repeat protein